ncbi:uncharacterized protein BDV17DRAFT_294149 [Aspergillus undulatus]|uniref:uncharacterized protein n=1 Tax=Aspergillus undulatus TaxID=1810928 RepID=UPI003CCDB870
MPPIRNHRRRTSLSPRTDLSSSSSSSSTSNTRNASLTRSRMSTPNRPIPRLRDRHFYRTTHPYTANRYYRAYKSPSRPSMPTTTPPPLPQLRSSSPSSPSSPSPSPFFVDQDEYPEVFEVFGERIVDLDKGLLRLMGLDEGQIDFVYWRFGDGHGHGHGDGDGDDEVNGDNHDGEDGDGDEEENGDEDVLRCYKDEGEDIDIDININITRTTPSQAAQHIRILPHEVYEWMPAAEEHGREITNEDINAFVRGVQILIQQAQARVQLQARGYLQRADVLSLGQRVIGHQHQDRQNRGQSEDLSILSTVELWNRLKTAQRGLEGVDQVVRDVRALLHRVGEGFEARGWLDLGMAGGGEEAEGREREQSRRHVCAREASEDLSDVSHVAVASSFGPSIRHRDGDNQPGQRPDLDRELGNTSVSASASSSSLEARPLSRSNQTANRPTKPQAPAPPPPKRTPDKTRRRTRYQKTNFHNKPHTTTSN